MAGKPGKWASNRGLISKIRPSDGCKGDTVPSTVVRGYDLRKPGGHLGNVGSIGQVGQFPTGVDKAAGLDLEDAYEERVQTVSLPRQGLDDPINIALRPSGVCRHLR